MLYKSTRGGEHGLSFEHVLFSAYARDGGLYVPETIPAITHDMLVKWRHHTFPMICAEVMHLFTDISVEALNTMTVKAYSSFNGGDDPLPMTQIGDLILLDASCGPTLAFKDIGQQIVAQLLNHFLSLRKSKASIMVDTSGDTGPAAIAAVRSCPNLEITVLYPHQRVSEVQELQMITAVDSNVHVYRTEGNNDDQSSVLKEIFADEEFVKSNNICSINSINWARIAAQSTYYIYAYLQIYNTRFSIGRPVNFCIPSGAFGNGAGGLLAKLMGLPIGRIICATNANDIVHRTITTGDMRMGANHQTISPAMDIQFAYNLERLVYFCCGERSDVLKPIMSEVDAQFSSLPGACGVILPDEIVKNIQKTFSSCSVSDKDTLCTIREVYEAYGYALCPHSAIGVHAAQHRFSNLCSDPMVCVLTAHPSKFETAFHEATHNPPPQLVSNPVHILKTLPQHFEWLRKNDDPDWRNAWIQTLKEATIRRRDAC